MQLWGVKAKIGVENGKGRKEKGHGALPVSLLRSPCPTLHAYFRNLNQGKEVSK